RAAGFARPAPAAHDGGQFLDRGRWPGPAVRWRPGGLPRLAATAPDATQSDGTRRRPGTGKGPQDPAARTGPGAAGAGRPAQTTGNAAEKSRGRHVQSPDPAGGTGCADG